LYNVNFLYLYNIIYIHILIIFFSGTSEENIKWNTRKSIITTLINDQWGVDEQENKIKTTLKKNYLFYLHNNWYVEVKCQIEWMDVKAGLQQSKNLVTASMGEWMNKWVE
jgi:hypothetical protein